MAGWMDGWMDGRWTDGRTDGWMDGCAHWLAHGSRLIVAPRLIVAAAALVSVCLSVCLSTGAIRVTPHGSSCPPPCEAVDSGWGAHTTYGLPLVPLAHRTRIVDPLAPRRRLPELCAWNGRWGLLGADPHHRRHASISTAPSARSSNPGCHRHIRGELSACSTALLYGCNRLFPSTE